MSEKSDFSDIAQRCNQITNSPYMRKSAPIGLQNLRSVLEEVHTLTEEDIPTMLSEIKRLRTRNKRLAAESEMLRSG